jgi:MarR-like DNA-binding transcriptional regulator SgrR of sgrS sRNA
MKDISTVCPVGNFSVEIALSSPNADLPATLADHHLVIVPAAAATATATG